MHHRNNVGQYGNQQSPLFSLLSLCISYRLVGFLSPVAGRIVRLPWVRQSLVRQIELCVDANETDFVIAVTGNVENLET